MNRSSDTMGDGNEVDARWRIDRPTIQHRFLKRWTVQLFEQVHVGASPESLLYQQLEREVLVKGSRLESGRR